MELPQPGSYRAKQNGTVIIRQEETGSLMAYIPYALIGVSYMGIHNLVLGAKDGTPQKKNIQTLKTVFPNWDIYTMADIEMPEDGEDIPQFDLADCYHDDSYTPEGAESPLIKFVAKWFNSIGGGKKQPMSQDERKAALTRWGSKFKAILGTTVKPSTAAKSKPAPEPEPEEESEEQEDLPTAKPTAKAPAKAAVSGPPSRKAKATTAVARTSTQEEVWEAFTEANTDMDEDERVQKYYDACDSVVDGSASDPALLDTPAKWGKVAEALGV